MGTKENSEGGGVGSQPGPSRAFYKTASPLLGSRALAGPPFLRTAQTGLAQLSPPITTILDSVDPDFAHSPRLHTEM